MSSAQGSTQVTVGCTPELSDWRLQSTLIDV